MQIVIDIPDEKYNTIKNKMYCGIYDAEVYEAISNGIPLPRGHGRLIENKFITVTDIREDGSEFTYVPYREVEDASTIIDADRSEEDGSNNL